MSLEIAKKRAEKLKKEIRHHRYLYHVLDKQEISDAALDSLKKELADLEARYPALITPDSPTQRVGGAPLGAFKKVRHVKRQWSFNDAFTENEVRAWDERVRKALHGERLEYVCELKIDGLHVVCTYEAGVLKVAATRGDGEVGEDVTHNIKTIESVPLRLRHDAGVIVEGEVWIPKRDFEALNAKRKKVGEPEFANPRNAAAGAIRQLDPRIAAQRSLEMTFYELDNIASVTTQEQELLYLRELGFKTDRHWKKCATIEEVLGFWRTWERKRARQPFWLDGVVIKVNAISQQERLGYTGKAPRFCLAVKFSAEQGTSVIRAVEWQVGRTGAVTPVAIMDPVHLAGTTVARATLHNFDEIERLDVRIGDTVIVEKAGDIIPKVVSVLARLRPRSAKKINPPRSIDGSPVIKKEGQVALYVQNRNLRSVRERQLQHFVSKAAFDITGLGKKNIVRLMDRGLLWSPVDIFMLTPAMLLELDGFAEVAAAKLVSAIAQRKRVPLARFINALGILHVGEETAALLARQFGTLERLRRATWGELEAIKGIGQEAAQSIVSFFSDPQSLRLLEDLHKAGVAPISQARVKYSGPLAGKKVAVTGTLAALSRQQVKDALRKAGADWVSSVSKETDFVVVGENPGSKHARARTLGVRIIEEREFLKMLGR